MYDSRWGDNSIPEKLNYANIGRVILGAVGAVTVELKGELSKAAQSVGNVSSVQMLRMQMMLQRWQITNESSSAIIKTFGDTMRGILQRF